MIAPDSIRDRTIQGVDNILNISEIQIDKISQNEEENESFEMTNAYQLCDFLKI